jgi:tetratricopeptide (TPR) repeat protein
MNNLCFMALVIVAAGSCALMTLPSYADNANDRNAEDDGAHGTAKELYKQAVYLRKSWSAPPADRIILLKQAIELYADAPAFCCELAENYRLQSDYPAALHAARRAIKLDSTYAAAWEEEGLALVQLQGLQVGLAALEKSAQLDPENPEVWLTLAPYRTLSSPTAGEEAYKYCLRLLRKPEAKVMLLSYPRDRMEVSCLSHLGSLRFRAKRYLEAKEFYEQAKAADVNHESLAIDQLIERADQQIRLQAKSSAK